MSDFQKPKIRVITMGILIFVLLIMLICFLSEAVKFAGYPFLILPDRLGIVQQVSSQEIISINLNSSKEVYNFPKAGKYVVYTRDYDLLNINLQLKDTDSPPWLRVISSDRSREVSVNYVKRGLRFYDTPLTPGRPILTFEIDTPGDYLLIHTTRPALIGILPDYVSGSEQRITYLYILQLIILLIPVFIVVSKVYRSQKKKVQEIQNLKKIKGEDFWRSEAERKSGSRWKG